MRRKRENGFDDRALSAWFNLPNVRAQRILAFHSPATAYRDCRAVPGRDFRIAVVCCALPAADRACPVAFGKSVRSVGAYDPGRHRFQHSLYPHFHGACRFASGFARHDLVVSYGLECPILLCSDPPTLSNNRNASRQSAQELAITKQSRGGISSDLRQRGNRTKRLPYG